MKRAEEGDKQKEKRRIEPKLVGSNGVLVDLFLVWVMARWNRADTHTHKRHTTQSVLSLFPLAS